MRPGLELGLGRLGADETAALAVLRMDPGVLELSLGMASRTGSALSALDWSEREGFATGINAGMYLPDNKTSVGYMRGGSHVNQPNAGSRLGAFFVAGPLRPGLPPADILERPEPSALAGYAQVVQNFRLIDSQGSVLWSEKAGAHSIAAVGKDASGRILFILCQEPLTAPMFAARLLSLPLRLSTVMYVEGGAQAVLFLRVAGSGLPADPPGAAVSAVPGGRLYVWKGRQSILNLPGSAALPSPNIIGAREPGGR